MIKGILVINNHGKPRLTKFYEHLVTACCCILAAVLSGFAVLSSSNMTSYMMQMCETDYLRTHVQTYAYRCNFESLLATLRLSTIPHLRTS